MTHPQDRQLAQDIFTGALLLVLAMLAYTSLHLNGSISPADECANTINESLSRSSADILVKIVRYVKRSLHFSMTVTRLTSSSATPLSVATLTETWALCPLKRIA